VSCCHRRLFPWRATANSAEASGGSSEASDMEAGQARGHHAASDAHTRGDGDSHSGSAQQSSPAAASRPANSAAIAVGVLPGSPHAGASALPERLLPAQQQRCVTCGLSSHSAYLQCSGRLDCRTGYMIPVHAKFYCSRFSWALMTVRVALHMASNPERPDFVPRQDCWRAPAKALLRGSQAGRSARRSARGAA